MDLSRIIADGKRQIICFIVAGFVLCFGAMNFFMASGVWAAEQASQATTERLVSIFDRGEERTILTNATTVRQVLKSAAIDVNETHDVVEPNIDMAISGTKFTVNIYRARLVTVVDGANRVNITTAERTPQRIAKLAGVTLYVEDTVTFSPSDNVAIDGVSLIMKIDRAKQRTVTEEAEINFEVEQARDFNQPVGYKEIRQLGEKGVLKVVYQVQAENGIEVGRKEVSSEIIKQPKKQIEIIGTKPLNPLTKSKGAHIFMDSKGVAHRETYYDLPMGVVMSACGAGGNYTVREDGAKVDKDGYVLVAANLTNYPRCSVVETSMGLGKVYDTGGFAVRHPHGFDLATDWTNGDGR